MCYVIIVTYNGLNWLDKCLNSIPDKYRIVVVDNASSDGTVAFIQNKYPRIKLFRERKNLGFGQANNIGISYALDEGADAVFLMNQDVYLRKDTLETLISLMKINPKYGILSPIHLDGNGDRLDRNFSYYINYDSCPELNADLFQNRVKDIYKVPFINAAAWLISRRTLEKVGGFNPIFFHYGEDDDYCNRLSFHDIKLGIVPKAFVLHDRKNEKSSGFKIYSKHHFRYLENTFKIKYGNPNNNYNTLLKNYNRENRGLRIQKIKALAYFNFKSFEGLRILLKKRKQWITEVSKNRKIVDEQLGAFL